MTKYTLRFGGGGGRLFACLAWSQTERNPFAANELGFPTSVRLKFTILVRIPGSLLFSPGRLRMHPPPSPAHETARARFPRPGPSRV